MKAHSYFRCNKSLHCSDVCWIVSSYRLRRQMEKWLKSYWTFCAKEMLRQWSTSSPHWRPLVNSMLHSWYTVSISSETDEADIFQPRGRTKICDNELHLHHYYSHFLLKYNIYAMPMVSRACAFSQDEYSHEVSTTASMLACKGHLHLLQVILKPRNFQILLRPMTTLEVIIPTTKPTLTCLVFLSWPHLQWRESQQSKRPLQNCSPPNSSRKGKSVEGRKKEARAQRKNKIPLQTAGENSRRLLKSSHSVWYS